MFVYFYRWLYFSDHLRGSIERCKFDGSSRYRLIRDVMTPYGLALGEESNIKTMELKRQNVKMSQSVFCYIFNETLEIENE